MPHQIITIPCLNDNYAFLIHDDASGATAVVDVPEAAPVNRELDSRGWNLSHILITHHHDDHVGGVEELRARGGVTVVGSGPDMKRLPPLDVEVAEGDTFDFAGETVKVFDVSGHTIGHIAFHFPDTGAVFTGDSLMAMGCGRLFEGTAAQMWESLSKLAELPPETTVCSGHEYTKSNAAFALTIEPDNPKLISRAKAVDAARADGKPTVPSLLSEELETNPFLRASLPEVKESLDMSGVDDAEVFGEIRQRKDSF